MQLLPWDFPLVSTNLAQWRWTLTRIEPRLSVQILWLGGKWFCILFKTCCYCSEKHLTINSRPNHHEYVGPKNDLKGKKIGLCLEAEGRLYTEEKIYCCMTQGGRVPVPVKLILYLKVWTSSLPFLDRYVEELWYGKSFWASLLICEILHLYAY